jgi:DNA (cytosine-5)-methyltransferase 1
MDPVEVSRRMRRIRSKGTASEKDLEKALRNLGIRYSQRTLRVLGKPDIVIRKSKIAIFVDGDYWHGGQFLRRGFASLEDQFECVNGKRYWPKKIRRNMARDCEVTSRLQGENWKVLRFWESDIKTRAKSCAELTSHVMRGFIPPDTSILASKTVAEFFAGIGLVRLGLQEEGWHCSFANDIDPQKQEMYDGHFGKSPEFILGDIHKLSPCNVPTVAIATASFPCNDLSLAGARNGLAGKSSSAFWGFTTLLEEMGDRKPPLLLIENVPGFLTSHAGKDFRAALMKLNEIGYSVDSFLVDAVRFVPQSRSRLFVVGVRNDLASRLPSPEPFLFAESEIRPRKLAQFILENPDINWSLRKLPKLPVSTTTLESILEPLPSTSSEWWDDKRAEYLFRQFSPRHKRIAEEMIAKRAWSYGTVFRRIRLGKSMAELRVDGVAGCLRTPRGGSARQILFKAGYGKYYARLLTARECAALMGADDYRLGDMPLNQALFGFGDAVCVPVIRWIARMYLNPIVNELIRYDVNAMELTSA